MLTRFYYSVAESLSDLSLHSMAPLRVGYVREHFASPLLQFDEEDQGKTFNLVECPGGTGQLIKALQDDQVDVVVCVGLDTCCSLKTNMLTVDEAL